MLSKKSSGAPKAARSAMPPPPSPVIRDPSAMTVDSFSELDQLLSQQYLSPDMTMSDSAAHGYAYSSAGYTGGVGTSGAGPGTAEVDLESFMAWISPSTAQQNVPLPPTPLSASTSFTSPAAYFSPFPEVLNTPVVDPLATFGRSPDIVNASPAQPLNLFDDLDNSGLSLFADLMTVAANFSPTSSSTVKPTALDLQLSAPLSRHQSWEQGASESSASNLSVSPPSTSNPLASPTRGSSGSSRAAPQPTGVRKNVKVADLIPIDAPIQPRNYITPSATSRKDIPPSVARTFVPNSRKRTASSAGLMSPEDMQDELAEEDPITAEEAKRRREMDPEKAALLEHVEQARRRNTLAARKSRQRKLEHVRGLEELVERLQQENEELKTGKEEILKENEELQKKLKAYAEKIESLGGVVPTLF